MRTFGLIGKSLSHSFSPSHFSNKFDKEQITDARYELFELESIDQLPSLLAERPDITGLNVTIPFKSEVIPFMDLLSEEAEAVGAVNTIDLRSGVIVGHNTDIVGFRESLIRHLPNGSPSRALILGDGGASRAVTYVLRKLEIPYQLVTRKGELRYSDLTEDMIKTHPLIINTTPVGMFPFENDAPDLPYQAIGQNHVLYDLIYNPEETRFLKNGRLRGALILNGMEMLQLQAEAAWKIWNS